MLTILRLGAHQILNLRVPAHAAVSQSVALARLHWPPGAGLVNAVLRRLARQGAPPLPDPARQPLQWLTSAGSLPEWLAQRWLNGLGPEVARARALACLETPVAVFRLNPRRTGAATEMASAGVGYRYGRSVYEDRPDAQSHTLAYTGSTTTRKEVGLTYALGVIATDVGDGSAWYTNGGVNFAARWSPLPDHSLSAGVSQDVSAGRGLGGATLDRGAYVGWSWSQVRGLGLAVPTTGSR